MSKRVIGLCPSKDSIVSYGSFGRCDTCKLARDSTADNNGKRICQGCMQDEIVLSELPKVVSLNMVSKFAGISFEDSDATFKCPSSSCGATDLSYREYWVGSCCENAAKNVPRKFKYAYVPIVNKIFERAREEEDSAEIRVEKAKVELQVATEELEKKIKWLKKVQKRSLLVTTAAMKEDNSDLDEPDELEKLKCKVCFELFDADHPEAVLATCGHKACFNCLSSLLQKTCPICRAEFTDDKVIKVFN